MSSPQVRTDNNVVSRFASNPARVNVTSTIANIAVGLLLNGIENFTSTDVTRIMRERMQNDGFADQIPHKYNIATMLKRMVRAQFRALHNGETYALTKSGRVYHWIKLT